MGWGADDRGVHILPSSIWLVCELHGRNQSPLYCSLATLPDLALRCPPPRRNPVVYPRCKVHWTLDFAECSPMIVSIVDWER